MRPTLLSLDDMIQQHCRRVKRWPHGVNEFKSTLYGQEISGKLANQIRNIYELSASDVMLMAEMHGVKINMDEFYGLLVKDYEDEKRSTVQCIVSNDGNMINGS